MADTLYFYDLETSGINPRETRIMQFAGQRTTLDLEPIGEPDNILVKLTDDILPEPYAILVTGITPQQTLQDGITEREFCKYFIDEVATPNTTIVGFNSVRFDNEFIRYALYRNFYDPYEWSYKNGNSVWDILDVVRMTRALRPDGIEWPYAPDGKPSNSLELLTSVNKLQHENAHDALSDVRATIAVAKLIKDNNPKLFTYLYQLRNKQAVQKLVTAGDPFVYTSGRYDSAFHKTSAAVTLAEHPSYQNSRALVYDLRHDPTEFINLSVKELAQRMVYTKDENAPKRLPVKELVYNRCPAIAPLSVLTKEAQDRIELTPEVIHKHEEILQSDLTFISRIKQLFEDKVAGYQTELMINIQTVDGQLYDGFFNDDDRRKTATVRSAKAAELVDLHPNFSDERLSKLLLLYKARQFSNILSEDEQKEWNTYRYNKFYAKDGESKIQKYFTQLQDMATKSKSDRDTSLLEDLWLWGENIMPEPDFDAE
jgi:exodeoxyribonuclease-1